MRLPSIDLGLMAEHLTVHEGMIAKLKIYNGAAQNPELKEIITEQLAILRSHVRIMLDLIDPNKEENVDVDIKKYLNPLDPPPTGTTNVQMNDRHIALEGHTTANVMARDNFESATMMKSSKVKQIHFNMAAQQVNMSAKYDQLIMKMGLSHPPMTSPNERLQTVQVNQHLLNE